MSEENRGLHDIEKVIKGLECHAHEGACGDDCPYYALGTCSEPLCADALTLINAQQERIRELEAGQTARALTLEEQNWVKCSDRMPEEHDSIFAKLKGTDKWRSAMFEKSSEDVRIVEVFEDGTRRVYHSHTIDGKWDIEKQPIKRTVTHWMPNPKLPKGSR